MDWSPGSDELRRSLKEPELNYCNSQSVLLGTAYDDSIAFLSGPKEVSVHKISLNSAVSSSPFYSHSEAKNHPKSALGTISKAKLSINLDTQPSVIAIGPDHIAAGLNTIAWFYALPNQSDWTFPSAFRAVDEAPVILVRNMEYVAIIKDIRLNSHYCATLFTDGRIHLHLIDPSLSKTDGRDANSRTNSANREDRMNSPSSFDPDLNFVMNSEFGDRIHSGSSLRHGYNGSMQVQDSSGDEEQKLIEGKERYSCIDLTDQLLVYGSFDGVIEFFHLKDWTVVDVYRHTSGIKSLSADVTGTKIGVIDENSKILIYNSVTGEVIDLPIDDLPTLPTNILWDQLRPGSQFTSSQSPICICTPDPNDLFIAYDTKNIYINCFIKHTIEGKGKIEFVASMNLPSSSSSSMKIIHLLGAMVYCQTLDSLVTELPLVARGFVLSIPSFASLAKDFSIVDRVVLGDSVLKDLLKLRRYNDAFKLCEYLNDNEHWTSLGHLAIHDLQVDLAIRAFSRMYPRGFGMVLSLKSVRQIEEKTLLSGHLAVFLEEYELAQQLFLKSSRPEEALHLRQNLQDWHSALVLAKRLSPHLIPVISREYASQLELTQDFDSALVYYEKALDLPTPQQDSENDDLMIKAFDGSKEKFTKHKIASCAGIARNSLRIGNTSRGLEILSHSNFKNYPDIQLECARILESIRLYSDAASLYENAHEYFKAAQLYLQVKNVNKVSKLLKLIDTVSHSDEVKCLFSEYAKIQETEHRYKEAIEAYEKAGDTLEVIRILLEKIGNPSEAMRLARESDSIEGKMKIAKFFQSIGEIPSALEFLVLSQCNSEAFQLASATGQMDVYANFLLNHYNNNLSNEKDENLLQESQKDLRSIALFYESDKNLLQAGRFHYLSGNSRKGVKLLLASIANSTPGASESEAIELAIEAAATSKDDSVIGKVIDFLVGDVDGVARDFKYLFRLYMKLGHFKDAAKTAVTIANEEQATGNYRSAHTMLFKTSKELAKHSVRMPTEMASSLLLIHSYLLSKVKTNYFICSILIC